VSSARGIAASAGEDDSAATTSRPPGNELEAAPIENWQESESMILNANQHSTLITTSSELCVQWGDPFETY
jgi:hypothetical protein